LSTVDAGLAENIKATAINTDKLIVKLDTLTNRIDTAWANENRELVEHYERQFAQASVEFMDGVETILDGWYALRGEKRPPAQEEYIAPETLDRIHGAVVSILQGLPVDLSSPGYEMPNPAIDAAQGVNILVEPGAGRPADQGPAHKVDVTG